MGKQKEQITINNTKITSVSNANKRAADELYSEGPDSIKELS